MATKRSAYDFYPTPATAIQSFLEADKFFRNEELVYMSNFTRSYLNALDYDSIRDRRLENFRLLNSMLSSYNEWEWEEKELSYMYPFLIQDGERLRRYLKEKISMLLNYGLMYYGMEVILVRKKE